MVGSVMFDREKHTDSSEATTQQSGADERLCHKAGCGGEAVASIASDYRHRIVAIGPVSPYKAPEGMDLCQRHADRFDPPANWEIIRYDENARELPSY